MARPGETEVFFITPEKGKCYEHAEATRTEYIGNGNYRYFTTNTPQYVGEFTKALHSGSGDGRETYSYFDNSRTAKEHSIYHSYAGNTCFREVSCPTPMERRGPAVAAWLRAKGVAKEDLKPAMNEHFGNLLTKNKFDASGGRRQTLRKKRRSSRSRKQTRR